MDDFASIPSQLALPVPTEGNQADIVSASLRYLVCFCRIRFRLGVPPKKDSLLARICERLGLLSGASQAPENVRKRCAVGAATRNEIFCRAVELRQLVVLGGAGGRHRIASREHERAQRGETILTTDDGTGRGTSPRNTPNRSG